MSLYMFQISRPTSLFPAPLQAMCRADDPNVIESSTNDATGQSLPDSGTVVSPESLRPTNRSPAVATSGALPHHVLPIAITLAPPPVPLTSMIPRKNTHSPALSSPVPLTVMVPRKSIFVSRLNAAITVNDVMHHIVTNLSLPNQNGIDITKFNFKQIRDYSSFKILVPDGLLSTLLCPNF